MKPQCRAAEDPEPVVRAQDALRIHVDAEVAGLVVEEGAILQHATTLARECGIPAAVGIRDARNLFQNGELLEVDGYTGKVSRNSSIDR